jgi:Nif-specific regulatory protein
MDSKSGLTRILEFFQSWQTAMPGDWDYDATFCEVLCTATTAERASVWQSDRQGRLHLVYGSDISPEEFADITLRHGEGISGAAALARRPIATQDAWTDTKHDRRIDERINFQTHSMIATPILFGDFVYGVVNVLNLTSNRVFPVECQEWLLAAGTLYGSALAAAGRLCPYDARPQKKGERQNKGSKAFEGKTRVVGVSPDVLDALELCFRAGKTDVPVLVRGETGTGKELAARRIHEESDRAKGPFLDVNCASITETLMESELFGHVKGAFSGADRDRPGKFVEASGGTLFLDEIGDMSPAFQAKILRALEDKKVTPVGSEKARSADMRFIAATNRDLLGKVRKGEFREDLYYRICGIEILMPPLRDRREDVPLLVDHFLEKACEQQRRQDPSSQRPRLSGRALEMLMVFSWPGNVRQLEQAILASAAICEGGEIGPEDFPAWLRTATESERVEPSGQLVKSRQSFEQPLSIGRDSASDDDRASYIKALERTKYPGTGRWNLAAAARELHIPRKTFVYRLRRLGLIR